MIQFWFFVIDSEGNPVSFLKQEETDCESLNRQQEVMANTIKFFWKVSIKGFKYLIIINCIFLFIYHQEEKKLWTIAFSKISLDFEKM